MVTGSTDVPQNRCRESMISSRSDKKCVGRDREGGSKCLGAGESQSLAVMSEDGPRQPRLPHADFPLSATAAVDLEFQRLREN
jgi:hypothetical protein